MIFGSVSPIVLVAILAFWLGYLGTLLGMLPRGRPTRRSRVILSFWVPLVDRELHLLTKNQRLTPDATERRPKGTASRN